MIPLVILAIEDPVKRARYEDAYVNYRQHLIAVAVSLLKDDSLAEDALQEAFASTIAKDALPEDGLKQKALLTTVVKNKALDILKNRKYIADEEPSEAQLGSFFANEQVEMDMLIDRLPDIYRDVIIMYYMADLSARKISGILGISYNNVLKRLERARHLLRKEYWEED